MCFGILYAAIGTIHVTDLLLKNVIQAIARFPKTVSIYTIFLPPDYKKITTRSRWIPCDPFIRNVLPDGFVLFR